MAKTENLKRKKVSTEEVTSGYKKLKKVKKVKEKVKRIVETNRDVLTEEKESNKIQMHPHEGVKQTHITDGDIQGHQSSKTDNYINQAERVTVDKSGPLQRRLIAISNENVSDTETATGFSEKEKKNHGKNGVSNADVEGCEAEETKWKKNKYKTTGQQKGEKKKQKREDKSKIAKQKDKTGTKIEQKQITESGTENTLWKKLKQVRKGPVLKLGESILAKPKPEKEAVLENISEVIEEEEEDPIKKAIREKKREKRRQKKAEKQRIRQENLDRAGTAGPAALKYLHTWENKREEWKFMKVRQVWLIKHMYDCEQINDDDFEILLRYLEPTNDRTREKLVEEAEEVIKKIEDEVMGSGEEDTGGVVSNYKMDRARQIIQLLAV